MQGVKNISSLHKDFFAFYLRSQLTNLESLLKEIENADKPESDYVEDLLKRVEKELCQFRRLYANNN